VIATIYLMVGSIVVNVTYRAWGIWRPVLVWVAGMAVIMAVLTRHSARQRGLGFWEALLHPSRNNGG
jgi:hypothetical protein